MNIIKNNILFSGIIAVLTIMAMAASFEIAHAQTADSQAGGFSEQQTQNVQGAQGGFTGPYSDPVTVAEALNMSDESKVVLKGNIIKGVGGEDYIFRDSTGEVQVNIDTEVWQGQQVGPEDTVMIYGEVDKEVFGTDEIEVDRLVKL